MMQMKQMLPFGILPLEKLKTMSAPLTPLGATLEKKFPILKSQLKQADLNITAKEYIAIMVMLAAFYFMLSFGLIFLLVDRLWINPPTHPLIITFLLALFSAFMVLVQLLAYPTIVVRRKVREIEKNLVFALRTILVQLKSGISLYYAMKVVAEEEYGTLSQEFQKMMHKINAGIPQETALQEMADANPSPMFRRVVWQMVNGLKGGGDIEKIISESLHSLSRQQKIGIEKYGAQLRVLSLVYMMIGIIIPALGLAFLIVIGSFPKISISEPIFILLLVVIGIMEFMFIGLIKSKRPTLISS
ncbi:MAG: type II secretion system F family protein [Candidatus Diapherotrites archaeon]